MDLKRLRTFVAVVELGTVTRAASRLCVSQPALSRQIYDLEQEFDIKLFDRVERRLMLTALGEQVLDDCRDVTELIDFARCISLAGEVHIRVVRARTH